MFICKWLSVGDCFWVRNRDLCSVLLSALGPYLVQTPAGPDMLTQSLWVQIILHHVDLIGFAFLVFSIPSELLRLLSPLLLLDSLNPEGRDLMKTSHLGLSVPRSLAFSIITGYGLLYLFLSVVGGRFSDDGWTRHWSSIACKIN